MADVLVGDSVRVRRVEATRRSCALCMSSALGQADDDSAFSNSFVRAATQAAMACGLHDCDKSSAGSCKKERQFCG